MLGCELESMLGLGEAAARDDLRSDTSSPGACKHRIEVILVRLLAVVAAAEDGVGEVDPDICNASMRLGVPSLPARMHAALTDVLGKSRHASCCELAAYRPCDERIEPATQHVASTSRFGGNGCSA